MGTLCSSCDGWVRFSTMLFHGVRPLAARRRPVELALVAVMCWLLGGAALAGNNPVDEKWWPTEFGADDQAGATNYITPESRVSAAKLVKQGKVATLGMPYHLRTPV